MNNPVLLVARLRSGAIARNWPEGLLHEAADRIIELQAERGQLKAGVAELEADIDMWTAAAKGSCQYIERLEAENEKLRNTARWIPVSERLPEKSQQVLGALKSSTGNYNLSRINRVMACDHDWEADGFEISNCWTVTHWMPLPEPPQEQEE